MRRRRNPSIAPPHVPDDLRALVPVMSPQGGAGRSTVAGLLAYALAPATAAVVVDPQPRVRSPWPDWIGAEDGDGLAGLFALGREPESYEVAHAAALRQLPLGLVSSQGTDEVHTYSVLADQRPWDSRPLLAPSDPAWYAALVERGGWAFGVVDTGFPATADHLRDRHKARVSQLAGWCRRPDAVPVIVTPATGTGLASVLQLLTALETDELASTSVIVAVSGLVNDDPPRRLRSTLQAIEARVFAVRRIPHDPIVRVNGLGAIEKVDAATMAAAASLARVVVDRARTPATTSTTQGSAAGGSTDGSAAASDTPTADGPTADAPGTDAPGTDGVDLAADSSDATEPQAAPAPPFPASQFPASSFTAMSANAGWVPIRRQPRADEDERTDGDNSPTDPA